MPDARAPEEPGLARIIRPGSTLGPKPAPNPLHRTAVSGIEAFSICAQYHGLAYDAGLKAADEKPARAIGTLIHVGLAYRYGALLPQRPEWMVYPTPGAPDPRHALWTIAQGNVEAAEEALRVFDAYQANYPTSIWKPVLVEHQFEVILPIPGGPDERYTLRIDLLAYDVLTGELCLIDHKCLPGDCTVATYDGPVRVDEIFGQWTAASLSQGSDESRSLSWKRARAPIHAGLQDTYSVRTKSGLRTRYGYRHPLLTQRGFVQAKDVVPGDKVAVAARVPDREDVPISDALITVVGLLTADGGLVSGGNSIVYTKTSAAFRKLFTDALRAEGMRRGAGGGLRKYRTTVPKTGKAPFVSLSNNSIVFQKLEALGLERVGSAKKRLPVSFLSMSARQAAVLIGAFWSSDGAMYVVREKQQRKVRIVYGSRSYGLCCDIRSLFTQLGILTTVTSSSVAYKGSRRGYHFTTVVGRESKRKFLKMVIFGEIPRPGGVAIATKLLDILDGKALRGKNPTIDGDIYWDTVESVLFAGKANCYDIEVPENHTFVADGLVTHNSTYKLTKNVGYSYRTDREMLTALMLCRANGYDVKRVVINAMTKERPEPKFGRYDVPISAEAYNRIPMETVHWIQQMRAMTAAFPDPTNRPRTYASCVRKFGVCLVAGSMIRTRTGWKKIEDVVSGDEVVGNDSQYHTVYGTASRPYAGDVIQVVPLRNSVGVTTTPEHQIFSDAQSCKEAQSLTTADTVLSTFAPSDWMPAIELLPFAQTKILNPKKRRERVPEDVVSAVKALQGKFVHRRVANMFGLDPGVVRRLWNKRGYKFAPLTPVLKNGRIRLRDGYKSLPETLAVNEEFAELAGLYIAEGHAENKIVFSFGAHENQLVARCRWLVERVLGEPTTVRQLGPVTAVYVSHGLWAHIFKQWFGPCAELKRMPTWLETAPAHIFFHAVHGWIEGDGGDRVGRGTQDLAYGVTSSYVLALQVWSGLCRAGLQVSVTRMTDRSGGMIAGREIVQRNPTYTIQIRSDALRTLAPVLQLPTPAAPRGPNYIRQSRFTENAMMSPVRKTIRKRYDGLVYDLNVPTSSSFLANGFVVHNCDMYAVCSDGPHRLSEFTKKW